MRSKRNNILRGFRTVLEIQPFSRDRTLDPDQDKDVMERLNKDLMKIKEDLMKIRNDMYHGVLACAEEDDTLKELIKSMSEDENYDIPDIRRLYELIKHERGKKHGAGVAS